MDRLFCMQAFVRVVEHGAFGRATDDLDTSRASVTEAVGRLEKRLSACTLPEYLAAHGTPECGEVFPANGWWPIIASARVTAA